jgi:hypothetical protein
VGFAKISTRELGPRFTCLFYLENKGGMPTTWQWDNTLHMQTHSKTCGKDPNKTLNNNKQHEEGKRRRRVQRKEENYSMSIQCLSIQPRFHVNHMNESPPTPPYVT